jgi:hypothetical protein
MCATRFPTLDRRLGAGRAFRHLLQETPRSRPRSYDIGVAEAGLRSTHACQGDLVILYIKTARDVLRAFPYIERYPPLSWHRGIRSRGADAPGWLRETLEPFHIDAPARRQLMEHRDETTPEQAQPQPREQPVERLLGHSDRACPSPRFRVWDTSRTSPQPAVTRLILPALTDAETAL